MVMKADRVYCIILAGWFIIAMNQQAWSQMFSVEEPARSERTQIRTFSFGLDWLEMDYKSKNRGDEPVFYISEPVYRMRLGIPGIEVYGAFGVNLGDKDAEADTLSYLNLGANLSGGLSLLSRRQYGLSLPLLLSTDYARVRSSESGLSEADEFRQSTVSIGVGGRVFYRWRNLVLSVDLVPQLGFTVEAIGSDSGQMTSLNGRATIQRDRLLGRFGYLIGYEYNWRQYRGGQEQFRYDIRSNGFRVGLSF